MREGVGEGQLIHLVVKYYLSSVVILWSYHNQWKIRPAITKKFKLKIHEMRLWARAAKQHFSDPHFKIGFEQIILSHRMHR